MKTTRSALLLALLFALTGLLAYSHAQVGYAQAIQPTLPQSDGSAIAPEDSADFPVWDDALPYQYPIVSYQPNGIAEPRSPAAVSINVWYGDVQSFGQLGIPQKWANILGVVNGATSNTTLSYRLNGGPALPLSIGPDLQRLYDDGSFNIELAYAELVPGANAVQITASDSGMEDVKTVTVNYTPDIIWPITYSIDWSAASSISQVAQVVDGQWEIVGGELRNVAPGYDRTVAIGDLGWKNYEVTVPVTVESLNDTEWGPPSNGAGVGFIASWNGHYQLDQEQPNTGWRRALGVIAWHRWNLNGSAGFLMRGYGGSAVLDSANEQIALNTTYIFKLSVQSSQIDGFPATYRFKYWPEGTPEPALWTMQGEGVAGEPASGSLLLVAHQAVARFGNVTVKPIASLPTFKIKVGTINNGSVIVEPNKPSYTYGEQVTVRALGDPGYVLSSWGGDLAAAGTQNPVVFDVTQDVSFKANFVAGADPTLTVTVDGNGTVGISPQKPKFQYGEIVTLTPKPKPGFLFAGWDGDLDGANNPAKVVMNGSKTISASFVPADTTSPVSDDFNSCVLNSKLWTFVNPVGDGSYEMTGDKLILTAPAGLSHNIWTDGNRSVRVMQPTTNDNFEIVTRFESVVTTRFQMQGILVQQDNTNFLRFEVHHDGKTVQAYAAKFVDGVPTPVITRVPLTSTPTWLRVTRTGTSWSFSYSYDSEVWNPAGSFDQDLNVTSSGVYAGNHSSGGGMPPAHQAVVDYFFNSASPIVPEDGQTVGIKVNIQGQGSVSRNPDQPQYACGDVVSLTAVPAAGWQFLGWAGDVSGSGTQKELVITGSMNVTATFVQQGGSGFKLYLPAIRR